MIDIGECVGADPVLDDGAGTYPDRHRQIGESRQLPIGKRIEAAIGASANKIEFVIAAAGEKHIFAERIGVARQIEIIASGSIENVVSGRSLNDVAGCGKIEGSIGINQSGQVNACNRDLVHTVEINDGVGTVEREAAEITGTGETIRADYNPVAFSEVKIGDRVLAIARGENELVGVITAGEAVIAKTAGDDIIAIVAAKIVRATAARQDVSTVATIETRIIAVANHRVG